MSPARCAAVASGNSTGAASTSPVVAGPVAAIAGSPPSPTRATGHSWVPSAPTSAVTAASGNLVNSEGANPADAATARTCDSIVPASQ